MKNLFFKFENVFLTKEFITFVCVGGINTLNGMLFPYIFSMFMNENIAYAISYIPSLGISYFLNSYFTFKDKQYTFVKYIKFCVSYIPNFIIQNVVFILVFNMWGQPKLIAIILASVIGVPVTFLIMKFFAFKKEK